VTLSHKNTLAVLGALEISNFLSAESYKRYGEEALLETIEHIKEVIADIRKQTGLN
jgi:hypothetical protein